MCITDTIGPYGVVKGPAREVVVHTAERLPRGDGTPSTDALVAEALRLLDDEGFAALSTRRLAARLGIHQPRIYRRIADRDELLGLVCDAIMSEVQLPSAELSSRAWLQAAGVELRRTWARHPHAAPLLHYGGAHPAISGFLDQVVSVLLSAGMKGDRLLAGLQAFLGYVFGVVMLEGRSGTQRGPALVDGSAITSVHHLQQLVATSSPEAADAAFRDGLALVLEGIFSTTTDRGGA
jgi:AcrR family transcriptional regulator